MVCHERSDATRHVRVRRREETPLERYTKNEPLVIAFMQKHFPKLSWDEDYLQTARMGLWEACKCFDPDRGLRFSTLAYVVMRNKVIKQIRRDRIPQRYGVAIISLDEKLATQAENGDTGILMDARDFTEYSDVRIDIDRMLKNVSPEERSIFVRITCGDITKRDAAKELGITFGELEKMLKRISETVRDNTRYDPFFDYGYEEKKEEANDEL